MKKLKAVGGGPGSKSAAAERGAQVVGAIGMIVLAILQAVHVGGAGGVKEVVAADVVGDDRQHGAAAGPSRRMSPVER